MSEERKSVGYDPKDQCGVEPFATGPHDPLIGACKAHDERAIKGGTPEEWFESERQLLKDAWALAGTLPTWNQRLWQRTRAVAFAVIDNVFGRPFWEPWDRSRENPPPKPRPQIIRTDD